MSYCVNLKVIVLLVVSPFLLCGSVGAEEMKDTKIHSIMMLNKAANKHRHQTTRPGPGSHSAKLRENRNSSIAAHHHENGEGVSIGNIYTHPGAHSPHSSTVIINGPIIVTGKN